MKLKKAISKPTIKMLSKDLGRLLTINNISLSVAESCTGGMIGEALTAIPGSSAYFFGGVISYNNTIKNKILQVPNNILTSKGAVSKETVKAMAIGVKLLFKTDCAIAVSGIAGPDGGSKEKPVGLVFIGLAVGEKVKSYKCFFEGNRQEIRKQSAKIALEYFIKTIDK